MAADRKMPNRKRKAPLKTARSKSRRAEQKNIATRVTLPKDVVSLTDYRFARTTTPDVAVRDGGDRNRALAKGHSAEVVLFTGVQIVRDTSNA